MGGQTQRLKAYEKLRQKRKRIALWAAKTKKQKKYEDRSI